jgi:hypothetical protein
VGVWNTRINWTAHCYRIKNDAPVMVCSSPPEFILGLRPSRPMIVFFCLVTYRHPWRRFRFRTGQPCDPDTDWQARACVAVGTASRDVARRQFEGLVGLVKMCRVFLENRISYVLSDDGGWMNFLAQTGTSSITKSCHRALYWTISFQLHCFTTFLFWRWRQYIAPKHI